MMSMNVKKGLFAATAAATLCAGATADVVIVLPSGNFGAGQDFSMTSPPLSGTLTGIIFSYEYSNAAGASWAADMAATVGASQWGYFNRFCNGASINEGATGAPNNGTPINFTSATLPIGSPVTYTNETVLVGWGNSWNGGSGTMANVTLTLVGVSVGNGPTNPTGLGASTNLGSGSVLLTVTTFGGINPASTGISVNGDLSALGGGGSVAFFDNGTNGDVTALDGVFSYTTSVGSLADGDAYSVGFTVSDAESRSSSGAINGTVDLAGQTLATAAVPSGAGALDAISGFFGPNDVDIYKINICDAANFSATTFGGTTADTQLFLFNTDGFGVVANDDVPDGLPGDATLQSTITSALIPGNGDYYLAVTRYNTDPVDAGAALIWANTPFNTERSPDGAGAGNPLAAWTGASAGTSTYTIAFTGTCYPSSGPICGLADVGGVGGAPGADNHLDNNDFVVFIDYFFSQNPIADQGSTGGVAGADGVYDNNDFIVFIDNFFNAPASCR
ncbi:MAG: GC-type dockerin domain-anchored protein [Phycisphaerales bacterium]|nr:GC-type dockerin domain-anchored protein [Phycisphaerales bacterium]